MTFNLDQLIDTWLAGFTPKHRRVLTGRFGLSRGKEETLQEIGDSLEITRERVRQIEAQAVKKLKPRALDDAHEQLRLVNEYLIRAGGVREDLHFLRDVKYLFSIPEETKRADEKLRFLFAVAETPNYQGENDEMRAFWYSEESNYKRFHEFAKDITQFFTKTGKEAILDQKVHLTKCGDLTDGHFLAILKNFHVNPFGDIGLIHWPEIHPRTVRDKSYLTLKKVGRPLHFREVAAQIYKLGVSKKRAHPQTVHNELIKDDRFVLVGRGMYGLKEFGYESGTVQEVIAHILKKKGPLTIDQVIQHVGEQRFLKVNTILLNLQNRKYFKRLDDGRYHVRTA